MEWKKLQTHAFSQLLTANKNYSRLLATLQNLDPAANRKLYMTPYLYFLSQLVSKSNPYTQYNYNKNYC